MKTTLAHYPEVLITTILMVICVIYFIKLNPDNRGINIGLPDKNEDAKEFVEQRSFTKINLTGDEVSDKSKLKLARIKLREIRNSQFSKEGVYFVFSEKSQYWAFVEVLDILETEKTESFGIYGNEIWSGNDNIPELKFE